MRDLLLRTIRFYQRFPPFHWPVFRALFMSDKVCRFRPTCSEYMYQAVDKYGILRGVYLGLKRIVRCHPFSKGGEDSLV